MKNKQAPDGFTFIKEGDTLAQVLTDGTVRVGYVKAPGRANGRGAKLRPRIDWSVTVPLALVRNLATELDTDDHSKEVAADTT